MPGEHLIFDSSTPWFLHRDGSWFHGAYPEQVEPEPQKDPATHQNHKKVLTRQGTLVLPWEPPSRHTWDGGRMPTESTAEPASKPPRKPPGELPVATAAAEDSGPSSGKAAEEASTDGATKGAEERAERDAQKLLVQTAFNMLDTDRNGIIKPAELEPVLLSHDEARLMLQVIDSNGNGTISYEEWDKFWRLSAATDRTDHEASLTLEQMIQCLCGQCTHVHRAGTTQNRTELTSWAGLILKSHGSAGWSEVKEAIRFCLLDHLKPQKGRTNEELFARLKQKLYENQQLLLLGKSDLSKEEKKALKRKIQMLDDDVRTMQTALEQEKQERNTPEADAQEEAKEKFVETVQDVAHKEWLKLQDAMQATTGLIGTMWGLVGWWLRWYVQRG